MKLTIESTNEFVETADGKFRLWIGTTELGHKCSVLVCGVLPESEEHAAEYADLPQTPAGKGIMLSDAGRKVMLKTGLYKETDFVKMAPEDVFARTIDKAASQFEEEHGPSDQENS